MSDTTGDAIRASAWLKIINTCKNKNPTEISAGFFYDNKIIVLPGWLLLFSPFLLLVTICMIDVMIKAFIVRKKYSAK